MAEIASKVETAVSEQDKKRRNWRTMVGLGCLMPATFSLISDAYPPQQRGRALGTLEGIGVLGIVIGTVSLGMVASGALWRWSFFLLGGFSVLSGLLVWLLVEEPVRGAAEPELAVKITAEEAAHYKVSGRHMIDVLRIPTIWVAIAARPGRFDAMGGDEPVYDHVAG
jgi:MFS family permease